MSPSGVDSHRPRRQDPWVRAPRNWRLLHTEAHGGFVTRAVYGTPESAHMEWRSRQHRKGYPLRRLGHHSGKVGLLRAWRIGLWLPRREGWWIGVLFMVGSALFAVPSLLGLGQLGSPTLLDSLFFLGSVFFTSAAYLQYVEAARAAEHLAHGRSKKVFVWAPHRIDWWAALTQWVGTLCFNVMTLGALCLPDSRGAELGVVWTTNVLGSLLFLVSSQLGLLEAARGRHKRRWLDRDWRIAAVNLLGSVCFGLSAGGAYVLPDGALLSGFADQIFTFLGAVGFFLAALWLLPEQGEAAEEMRHQPTPGTDAHSTVSGVLGK